ncbi:hypothetical protein CCM_00552 [Cordyceps militaris CM01]|uniref:Uncharacterized protein n=1 Tax=Cordyceps militaris (strain CM01) TaxID=983644 RepID=G3J4T1_CORMM|nr:uncharacterized protein CCM_00552 [Cordyceps militaris CM01]EGX95898.1 hypothetical protein CCM_00552 [Cordyceps militaris CM01]
MGGFRVAVSGSQGRGGGSWRLDAFTHNAANPQSETPSNPFLRLIFLGLWVVCTSRGAMMRWRAYPPDAKAVAANKSPARHCPDPVR